MQTLSLRGSIACGACDIRNVLLPERSRGCASATQYVVRSSCDRGRLLDTHIGHGRDAAHLPERFPRNALPALHAAKIFTIFLKTYYGVSSATSCFSRVFSSCDSAILRTSSTLRQAYLAFQRMSTCRFLQVSGSVAQSANNECHLGAAGHGRNCKAVTQGQQNFWSSHARSVTAPSFLLPDYSSHENAGVLCRTPASEVKGPLTCLLQRNVDSHAVSKGTRGPHNLHRNGSRDQFGDRGRRCR